MAPKRDDTQYHDQLNHITQVVDLLLAQSSETIGRFAALEVDRIDIYHAETEQICDEQGLSTAQHLAGTETACGFTTAIDCEACCPFPGHSCVSSPNTILGDHTTNEEETLSVEKPFVHRIDHYHRVANPFAARTKHLCQDTGFPAISKGESVFHLDISEFSRNGGDTTQWATSSMMKGPTNRLQE